MSKSNTHKLVKISQVIFLGLLAYMPLHIFISTLIGANIGGLEVLKVLKDIVAVFGFCLIFGLSVRKPWFDAWIRNKLVIAIMLYASLTLLLALFKSTDQDAEILGVVFNLRFPMFLLYGWLLTQHLSALEIRRSALRVVLGSGLIVVLFGILQYLVLPNDALTHLGFTTRNGVFSAFFIDNKPDLERVMSTLRDPNSLGSYLLIITALVASGLVAVKQHFRNFWIGYGLAALLCLLLTFSRSALIGFILSIASTVFIVGYELGLRRYAKKVGIIAAVILVIATCGFVAARNTYFIQNVIFHADKSTVQEDPNQLRVRFLKESVSDVKRHPIGNGPGTAGLASIKNDIQGTRLTENYYLQIAIEVGVIGLLMFIAILLMVSIRLWSTRGDPVVIALMASFAGLALTNLLVHIWSNEAVAYTWWGLAGLYMSRKTIKSKRSSV